ncbi:MAG: extracellular solute-binding protein [Pygmaiobacter sp.]|nr:extracellular solute-binding protein [Pygmaiobacter sp.]
MAPTPPPTATATAEQAPPTPTPKLTGTLTVYLERPYTDDYPVWLALKQFEAENPALTVDYCTPPIGDDPDGVREATIMQLETEIMSGGGPDVFLLGWRHSGIQPFPDMQKAMRNGSFLDCKALLAACGADVDGPDFWPGLMAAGQVDGGQYVVPLAFSIPVAVAAAATLERCGFDETAALQNTAAFYAALAQIYAETGEPSYNEVFQTTNMALPVLDYVAGQVNFSGDISRRMLTLDRENFTAAWNQGRENFKNEFNVDGSGNFACQEAARLAAGTRLLDANRADCQMETAWALADRGESITFLPVPNENGGSTAVVDNYAAINANTANPQAAAALLSYLLAEPQQSAAAWPGSMPTLAVRKSSLGAGLESVRQFYWNTWWYYPTEEEKQAYFNENGVALEELSDAEVAEQRKEYGAALAEADVATLARLCGGIDAVYLQNIWDHAVNIGTNADGDDLMNSLYDRYLYGEISLDELVNQIEPRLQLYLDE